MVLFLLPTFAATDVLSRWAPPRLVSIPALLILAALVSVVLFNEIEAFLLWDLRRREVGGAAELSRHRTRLLSSFIAINIFFWFADPTLGLWGGSGGQLLRSLVLVVSAAWLVRGWSRDADVYRRELLSISLRKQLQPFESQLSSALDGRSLSDLTPSEVFLLARVLPEQQRQLAATIYRNVLGDMFRSGRLDSASALLYLQELRDSLNLDEEEHHFAMRELALLEPHLMTQSAKQQLAEDLRAQAAKQAVADLLDVGSPAGSSALDGLTARQRQRLERIRRLSGLDDDEWSGLLDSFFGDRPGHSPMLDRALSALEHLLVSRESLERCSHEDPMLHPLMVAIDLQILSVLSQLLPSLNEALPAAVQARWSRLRQAFHVGLDARLALRGLTMPALSMELDTQSIALDAPWPPVPRLEDVLRELWQDPDPLTAAWSLRCLERHDAAQAEALERQCRLGASASSAVRQLRGDGSDLLGNERSWREMLLADPAARQCTPSALMQRVA